MTLILQCRRKIREVLLCFAFPSTFQGVKQKATSVQSPLDFSCNSPVYIYPHRHTHACTRKHKNCMKAKALPGSGWGLGWGRPRPWELQDTGGKMSGAQQRCGRPRTETEAKTNPAMLQGAARPQGLSHQLHLGLRVLLDLGLFHGYQILAFVECIVL